jgi:hypothetical protein
MKSKLARKRGHLQLGGCVWECGISLTCGQWKTWVSLCHLCSTFVLIYKISHKRRGERGERKEMGNYLEKPRYIDINSGAHKCLGLGCCFHSRLQFSGSIVRLIICVNFVILFFLIKFI